MRKSVVVPDLQNRMRHPSIDYNTMMASQEGLPQIGSPRDTVEVILEDNDELLGSPDKRESMDAVDEEEIHLKKENFALSEQLIRINQQINDLLNDNKPAPPLSLS